MKFTQAETDCIEQMKARTPKYIKQGGTMEQAIAKAHAELQGFIGEMAVGESHRAKRAALALSAVVWRDCRNRDNNRQAIAAALGE